MDMEDIFKRKRKKSADFYKTQEISREDIRKKSVPRICCRCKAIYEIETWEVDEGKPTGASHGYCTKCFEELKKDLEAGEDKNKK